VKSYKNKPVYNRLATMPGTEKLRKEAKNTKNKLHLYRTVHMMRKLQLLMKCYKHYICVKQKYYDSVIPTEDSIKIEIYALINNLNSKLFNDVTLLPNNITRRPWIILADNVTTLHVHTMDVDVIHTHTMVYPKVSGLSR